MPETMKLTQEPDFGPRTMRVHGSLLVLALLAFAVCGTSGLVGAVFRSVLERSDRFRDAVIDWAHDKEIAGLALVIGISGRPHCVGRLARPKPANILPHPELEELLREDWRRRNSEKKESRSQALGRAVANLAEGILAPSRLRNGKNLIVFPRSLKA
jgi:hypothetical protein